MMLCQILLPDWPEKANGSTSKSLKEIVLFFLFVTRFLLYFYEPLQVVLSLESPFLFRVFVILYAGLFSVVCVVFVCFIFSVCTVGPWKKNTIGFLYTCGFRRVVDHDQGNQFETLEINWCRPYKLHHKLLYFVIERRRKQSLLIKPTRFINNKHVILTTSARLTR